MQSTESIFVGKVMTLPTKEGRFKAYSLDEMKEYSIQTDRELKLWLGDAITCLVKDIDENTKLMICEPIVQVACDERSFVHVVMRGMSSNFTAHKCKALYTHLLKQCTDDQTPYSIMSGLARIYENPFSRRDNKAVKELTSIPYKWGGKNTELFTEFQAEKLLGWWNDCYDVRRLYYLGLKKEDIDKCNVSNFELYERLVKNPYTVAEIPLEKCTSIDERTRRIPHPLDKYCGQVLRYIVSNSTGKGWTCTLLKWVLKRYGRFDEDEIMDKLRTEFRLIIEEIDVHPDSDEEPKKESIVYYIDQYRAEKRLAEFLIERISAPPYNPIEEPEYQDEELDVDQRAAIKCALNNNVSIITGPAGSGKTRTVQSLVYNLELYELSKIVTSYTGKAVIRAKELNGLGNMAATMHRILFGNFEAGLFKHVIIDEATMVDNWIMWVFIMTFTHEYSITLIGDVNQLPPISWGSFFQSCYMSRSVPCVKLTSIHRTKTSEGIPNGIIINSTRITQWPPHKIFPFEETANFRISNRRLNSLKDIILELKARGFQAKDVTVISPYRKRKVQGKDVKYLDEVNQICQLVWNRSNPYKKTKEGKMFFVGDRVMLTKNNYQVDVFNGQEGVVVGFEGDDNNIIMLVNFPTVLIRKKGSNTELLSGDYIYSMELEEVESISDKEERVKIKKIVRIPFDKKFQASSTTDKLDKESVKYLDISLIELSFALTVHKAQGSEWRYVIFYMPPDANIDSNFLCANLNYVGLTRAGDHIILLDPENNTSKSIANPLPYRCECLTSRLMAGLPRLYPYVEKVIDEKSFEIKEEDEFNYECDEFGM